MVSIFLLLAAVCFLLAACGATWPTRVNLTALGLLLLTLSMLVPGLPLR